MGVSTGPKRYMGSIQIPGRRWCIVDLSGRKKRQGECLPPHSDSIRQSTMVGRLLPEEEWDGTLCSTVPAH